MFFYIPAFRAFFLLFPLPSIRTFFRPFLAFLAAARERTTVASTEAVQAQNVVKETIVVRPMKSPAPFGAFVEGVEVGPLSDSER